MQCFQSPMAVDESVSKFRGTFVHCRNHGFALLPLPPQKAKEYDSFVFFLVSTNRVAPRSSARGHAMESTGLGARSQVQLDTGLCLHDPKHFFVCLRFARKSLCLRAASLTK